MGRIDMTGAGPKRPEMILANPPLEVDASAPADQVVRREAEIDAPVPAAEESPTINSGAIAERVYQLMRDELAIERKRRGWER
jgi:hypothetical protein